MNQFYYSYIVFAQNNLIHFFEKDFFFFKKQKNENFQTIKGKTYLL